MAFNEKELTIDYRKLLTATNQKEKKQQAAAPKGSPSELAQLTPTQLAKKFPTRLASLGGTGGAGGAGAGGAGLGALSGGPGGVGGGSSGSLSGGTSAAPGSTRRGRPAPNSGPEGPSKEPPQSEYWQGGSTEVGLNEVPRKFAGTVDRSSFNEQLKDPTVRNALAARISIEVGTQGKEAQQMFAETVFNRAQARGQTIIQAVNNHDGYYPQKDNSTWKSLTKRGVEQHYYDTLDNVHRNGTNIVKGATGNESGGVHSGGAPVLAASRGERFVLENRDSKWRPTFNKSDESQLPQLGLIKPEYLFSGSKGPNQQAVTPAAPAPTAAIAPTPAPAAAVASETTPQPKSAAPAAPAAPAATPTPPTPPQESAAAPEPAAEPETPELARGGEKQVTSKKVEVVTDDPLKTSVDRTSFNEQLKDPTVRNALAARMSIETGSQGKEAQQMFAEVIFNRAQARNMTIVQAVDNHDGYYPMKDNEKWKSLTKKGVDRHYYDTLDEVHKSGTNLTKGATGNESGSVRSGGAPVLAESKGERYVLEHRDKNWTPTYQLPPLDLLKPEHLAMSEPAPMISAASAPAPEPVPMPAPALAQVAAIAPEPAPAPEPAEPETAKFAHGGEKQISSDKINVVGNRGSNKDNALVIDEKGKPLFKVNVDKERMTYDPGSTKMKVEPIHRLNQDDILAKGKIQDWQMKQQAHQNVSNQNVQPPPSQSQRPRPENKEHWSKMVREMTTASTDIYKTASVRRAMAGTRFKETGDVAKGGHYATGASNLRGRTFSKQESAWK